MKLLAAALAVTIALSTAGCAALASVLPDVIAAVTDGAQILDVIERFVANYFASHPDAEAQKRLGDAVTRCRVALNVALRTAKAAKALDDQQVEAAFDEFKRAYLELLALTKPYGVHPAGDGRLRAAPGGGDLEVPEPLAFHPRASR